MKKSLLFFIAAGIIFFSLSAIAAENNLGIVTIQNDTEVLRTFTPFASTLPGTIGSIAAGDLGDDGVAEILVGAGVGIPPLVSVFRQDGSAIGSFLAYNAAFTRGVNVAVCDVNGDGTNEIVTGTKYGGGPHVRIFDAMGTPMYGGFFAYDKNFRGGVNIACGDVNGDGVAEIVTGAGASGGPHIKVFHANGSLVAETFNGNAAETFGVYVGVDDDTILASSMSSNSIISTYIFNNDVLTLQQTVTPITRDAMLTTATLDAQTIAVANITTGLFHDTSPRYILVDLSEQRLYAYSNGALEHSFLVSTGKRGFDTPVGITSVTAKFAVHDYSWYYGANDPRNYSLPNVKWNLRFRPHLYIHSAYWHNNFGHVMSHGCVNTSIPDAEWIFHWANIGTPVEVQN